MRGEQPEQLVVVVAFDDERVTVASGDPSASAGPPHILLLLGERSKARQTRCSSADAPATGGDVRAQLFLFCICNKSADSNVEAAESAR